MKYLIDGIDRLGKSTLIENILQHEGYHLVIHYDKPKVLQTYKMYNIDGKLADLPDNAARKIYQEECNKSMFSLLSSKASIIFDRTHLGELVYAPLYRGYSGEYVLTDEAGFVFHHPQAEDVKLILLTTSNLNITVDDGQSFDYTRRGEEQELFKSAFNRSILPKIMVDVHNGHGGYKSSYDILKEVLGK